MERQPVLLQVVPALRARGCLAHGLHRWDQQRDGLHTAFAQRYAQDPTAQLPLPDAAERKMWPIKEGFMHASVINGYNSARREVIFSESWAEFVRNRRMRVEELEATSYLVYYPRL